MYGLGDWNAIDTSTPLGVTASTIYYWDAIILSQLAGRLNNINDQTYYNQIAQSVKNSLVLWKTIELLHDFLIFSEVHFHQHFGKICFKCNKVIVGEVIAALGKHYHADHFVCHGCEKPLGKEICDWDSKPLCPGCFGKLPKEIRKRIEKKKKGEEKALADREKQAKQERKAMMKNG